MLCVNSTKNLFVKYDILTYFPLCRVNRGDCDEQKTTLVNNTLRMMISSQCIKRNLRIAFGLCTEVSLPEVAEKVKNFTSTTKDEVYFLGIKEVEKILNYVCNGVDIDATDTKNDVTVYVTLKEIYELSQEDSIKSLSKPKSIKKSSKKKKEDDNDAENTTTENVEENSSKKKKSWIEFLSVKKKHNVVMDLFGAMYASNPDVNVESAIEVAPAISIDEVKPTEDYFTAVSSNKNRKGSLHLNSRILCSGFMHFHVKLDLGDLVKKGYTKEELIWIVKTLTEALYFLQFKSGQSGTAHHSIPSLFNVSFSSNVMYLPNYSGLFYRPVNACTDHIKDIDEIVEDIQKKIKLSVDSINRMVDTLCKESLAKVWYHPLSVDFNEYKEIENHLSSCLDTII